MASTTVILQVPEGLDKIVIALYHNWAVGLVVIFSATILSAVTFLINKKWSKKQQQAVLTRTLHFVMVGVAALFGLLGQLVPFLHDNMAVFRTIPHVGEYVISVYAAANFLYALKLKAWFQAFASWASKETGEPNPYGGVSASVPQATPQPVQSATDSFL